MVSTQVHYNSLISSLVTSVRLTNNIDPKILHSVFELDFHKKKIDFDFT